MIRVRAVDAPRGEVANHRSPPLELLQPVAAQLVPDRTIPADHALNYDRKVGRGFRRPQENRKIYFFRTMVNVFLNPPSLSMWQK